MTQPINAATGKPDQFDNTDELEAAIKLGTHSYAPGTKVDVVDQDGESYNVDSSELNDTLASGYKIETPNQKAVRQYVKENKGVGGALKVAAGQALDELSLGIPEILLDKYQDPLEVAKREALKKEHSIANTIGGTAGFLGSTVVGAPLWKGAATGGKLASDYLAKKTAAVVGSGIAESAAGKLAGNAAKKAVEMGVEGTIASAPVAITEAMIGDHDLAAETLLSGGLFGSVLGGAIGVGKPIATLGVNKAKEAAEGLVNKTNVAYKLIGASDSQKAKLAETAPDVQKMLPDFLRKFDRSTLSDSSKLKAAVDDIAKGSKSKLDEVVNTIDDKLNKKIITQPEQAAAIKDSMFDYDALKTKIKEKYVTPYAADPGYAKQISKVDEQLSRIDEFVKTNFGGDYKPIDVKKMREFKHLTDGLIYNFGAKGKTGLAVDAAKTIRNEIQDYMKFKLGTNLDNLIPESKDLSSAFTTLNNDARVAHTIQKIISKKAIKEGGGKGISRGDLITAYFAPEVLVAQKLVSAAENAFDVGGLLMAEKTMKDSATKIDGIGSKLKYITDKNVRAPAVAKISQLTNDKNDDDFTKLSEKIVQYSSNPESMGEKMTAFDTLSNTGAPQISGIAQQKTIEAIQYLNSVMPKPLSPNNALVKNKPYKPSDAEYNKFKRQVRTALDPFSIVDDLNAGTLTSEQVETVRVLYPKILLRIQDKVIDTVSANPQNVPYNKRLKLSLLLGLELDPSLEQKNLNIIMNNKVADNGEGQQTPSNNATFTSYPTEIQRMMSK